MSNELMFYITFREILNQSKSAFGGKRKIDIHTKLMRAYKQVPTWWFIVILVLNIGLSLFACQYYNISLQLPWWGLLLACFIAFFFTLPIGIICATTNQVNHGTPIPNYKRFTIVCNLV